ncbi:unnamed protein product [Mytilus edulis]|uniref:C1q domain-containing protein n=1 Tax=Mytilus edulis TaxID=6550 RepID=A0A8S3RYL4_MYTED|nr:unnamed protein product [Mytilus edulis]
MVGSYLIIVFIALCGFHTYYTFEIVDGHDLKELKLLIIEQNRRLNEFGNELEAVKFDLASQRRENSKQNIVIETLKSKLSACGLKLKCGKSEMDSRDGLAENNKEGSSRKPENYLKVLTGGLPNSLQTGEINTGDAQKRLLVTPVSSVIAFSAYMSKNEDHVVDHHILTFDTVQTNEGNGYNRHTGIFIVPTSGVYVFTYTLMIGSNSEVCTNLLINEAIYGHAYSYSGSLNVVQTSMSIVVAHVNQGDTVFVRTANDGACGQTGVVYGDTWRRSTFAGWLLA